MSTEIFTRTIYGGKLQSSMLLGKTPVIDTNTTLNEKFNIQANAKPSASDRLAAKYLAIGIGGHRSITGAEGITYTAARRHRASDAACFKHLPFVLRRTNNDLTVDERAKYALRREETHGGLKYYAYYLKRVDLTDVEPGMWYTSVDNGVESTPVQFVPSSSNLNPVQTDVTNTEVVSTSGDYFSISSIVPIAFTADDVTELKNVAKIIYDNELMAIISEIALCSGVDRNVTGQVNGSNFTYTEAIGVQILTHITTYYSVGFTNEGFDFTFELGETEPMFNSSDVTSGN